MYKCMQIIVVKILDFGLQAHFFFNPYYERRGKPYIQYEKSHLFSLSLEGKCSDFSQ